MDKLKYKVFHALWCVWHIRLRFFLDRFAPPCSSCQRTLFALRGLAESGFKPAQVDIDNFRCRHVKYAITSRPWWHMCCNGDAGGWRTHVCSWLENRWRSTETYNNG